jgi:hypothetical protein
MFTDISFFSPGCSLDKFIQILQTEIIGLKGRIDKKNAYLQELEDQVRIFSSI